MPKLPERYQPHIVTTSIGGSALFLEHQQFYQPTLQSLLEFFRHEVDAHHTVIAVIGGGPEARHRMDAEKSIRPDISNDELDRIGIEVTKENALLVGTVLSDNHFEYEIHDFGEDLKPGVIYVRGGTRPGRTTDAVAIAAAEMLNLSIVLNISQANGLHPMREGKYDMKHVISDISWAQYLIMFPQKYRPGMRNVPIDPVAAQKAIDLKMTVILMSPNANNLISCLNGEEFVGTIIHP